MVGGPRDGEYRKGELLDEVRVPLLPSPYEAKLITDASASPSQNTFDIVRYKIETFQCGQTELYIYRYQDEKIDNILPLLIEGYHKLRERENE